MASKPKKQAVRLEPTPQELEQQMNELRNFMARERRQELFDLQRLTPSAPRDLEFERYLAGKATPAPPSFLEASKASQPAFGMYPQMKGKRVFNDREASANAPLSALRGLASGTLGLAGDVESLGRLAIPNASDKTFFPSSEDFQRVLPGRDLTASPTGAAAQFAGNLFADAGIYGTAKLGTAAAKLAGKGAKGLGKLTAEQLAKGMEGSGPMAKALAPVSNRYVAPTSLKKLKEEVLQSKGEYGAKRVERAADEIKNLERMFSQGALRDAFLGDNARALMTMNPADFEKYAKTLPSKTSVGPKAAELAKKGEIDKHTVTTDEYIKHLQRVQGGFDDMPYLLINKEEQGLPLMPFISGHEGRHRSRAMTEAGEPSSLVRLEPRSELREPFPRRSQEEYLEALRKELEMTDDMVLPEKFEDVSGRLMGRPAIKLPDVYAKGGAVHVSDNPDTMQMDLADQQFQVGGLAKLGKVGKVGKGAKSATRKFMDVDRGTSIIKETGGNWVAGAGSPEAGLKSLKRKELSPEDMALARSRVAEFQGNPEYVQGATRRLNEYEQDAALNKWINSNLTNYVKKQMGTADDPVRKLAEEGVAHFPSQEIGVNRYKAGDIRTSLGMPQLGKSEAAKAWEDATDTMIDVAPASKHTRPLTESEVRQGVRSTVDANPWLEKVAPDTPIHAAKSDIGSGLGFDHIMDVLRQDLAEGRIRPEQLNKVSMEQAVRRTYEYDQEMARKMAEAQIKATEGMPTHKDYGDKGYKWIELTSPKMPEGWAVPERYSIVQPTPGAETLAIMDKETGKYITTGLKSEAEAVKHLHDTINKDALSSALKYEGETMGHCVGNYCEDVAGGKSRIFSLRSAKGEPHVTIETKPKGAVFSDVAKHIGKEEAERLLDEGVTLSEMIKNIPDFQYPQKIVQIKGKQNRAPNEEYLPFVQDFVKSGKWADVGDIQNTGLQKWNDRYLSREDIDALTPEESDAFSSRNLGGMKAGGAVAAKIDGNDFVLAAQAAGLSTDIDTLNKIVTRVNKGESLQEAARAVAQEGGRSVHISDNPDTMRLELDERKYQVGGIVKAAKAAKDGKGLYSAVDKAALGLKRPMGTGKEFMAEIKSTPGVKATELKSRSLADIEAMPKMTKDKFIKELEARPPIKIEEKVLGQPSQQDIDALVDKLAYEKGLNEAREFGKYGDDIDDMAEENYRLSLKYDKDELEEKAREMLSEGDSGPFHEKYAIPGGQNYREILLKAPAAKGEGFLGVPQHFGGEPNILASIRVSDRMVPQPPELRYVAVNKKSGFPSQDFATPEELDVYIKTLPPQIQESLVVKQTQISKPPQKVLHVEEIQSDWHQAGRKARTDEIKRLVDSGMSKQEAQAAVPEDYGYSTNMAARRKELHDRYMNRELSLDQYDYLDRELTSVPDAPFKKDWQELALRKVMELASEGGYDKVALTPGVEQASRYDLSKQIDSIEWDANTNRLYAKQKNSQDFEKMADDVTPENLASYIGQEAAEKMMARPMTGSYRQLSGLDLQVGGEGMSSFYDKMLPDYLNKLGKQYGVEVSPMTIDHITEAGSKYQVPAPRRTSELHGFDVTPQMRQDITEKGLPLYQQIGVPVGTGAVGAEAIDQPVEGMKAGGAAQKSIKDRIAEHRATKDRKFQAGGAVRALKGVSAAERAAAGRKAAAMIKAQPEVKASEALGQAREKGMTTTMTTQADRTRVGGGNIGGGAFSAISEADPLYTGKTWGVMDAGTASRLKNLTTPETAWTTMLGSATQLKTNPIVFAKLEKQFKEALKQGLLSPELQKKINHNLELTFGEGADIRDPKIWKQADTFEKRAALADLMMGQGIAPKKGGVALGGEKSGKGVIFKPTETLIRETEPSLLHPEHGGDVPTFAAGPRLFTLSGESSFRPDLHPGFPELLEGKDLGVSMKPTPTEVYLPEWHKKFKAANPERYPPFKTEKQAGPGYYDLALGVKGEGLPSQQITDEYIRHLIREGFKEGGAVKKKPKNQRKLDKPRVKISSNPDTMYMELNSKRK